MSVHAACTACLAKCPGRWWPRIPRGSCSGLCQRSEQPGVPQRTSRWPPRASLAGRHSHGRQSRNTVPGFQGCPRRHCSGKPGNITRLGCSMSCIQTCDRARLKTGDDSSMLSDLNLRPLDPRTWGTNIRTSETLSSQSVMCGDLRIVCFKAGRVVPTWSPVARRYPRTSVVGQHLPPWPDCFPLGGSRK